MAKINLVKKTILLSPTLHAIRGTTSGYIWDPSEDGNSQQVTLPPIAQYAFDHGGDIPPNWNENDTFMMEPNMGSLVYGTYRNG